MAEIERWLPERQPSLRACAGCKENPDRQVLPGHDGCLPFIGGRYTADPEPVLVTVGLEVWDYDLRPGRVTIVDYSYGGTPDGPLGIVSWHMVERLDGQGSGTFDGTRMWTRHPVDGRRPQLA